MDEVSADQTGNDDQNRKRQECLIPCRGLSSLGDEQVMHREGKEHETNRSQNASCLQCRLFSLALQDG